jgi:hypothetical protein
MMHRSFAEQRLPHWLRRPNPIYRARKGQKDSLPRSRQFIERTAQSIQCAPARYTIPAGAISWRTVLPNELATGG